MQLKRPVKCKPELITQQVITIFSLSLILILNCAIYAQVRIKERVEIKPDSIRHSRLYNVLPGQKGKADLKIEFSASRKCDFGFQIGDEGYSRKGFSGDISFTIPDTYGYYTFGVSFLDENGYLTNGCYTLKKYFNNFLIESSSGCGLQSSGEG